MKKWICGVLFVLIMALSLCGCTEKSSSVEDFEYEMVDGEKETNVLKEDGKECQNDLGY